MKIANARSTPRLPLHGWTAATTVTLAEGLLAGVASVYLVTNSIVVAALASGTALVGVGLVRNRRR
jgi:hypothetical protein